MSYQLLKQDVLFYQRFLKVAGFYNDTLDGNWGPQTNKADTDFKSESANIAEHIGKFDAFSEKNITTLLPKAQTEARRFMQLCQNNKFEVRIISGTRTYAEQEVLYTQGRTTKGKIVTFAKGGQSNHNFGIAWDIGLFDTQGKYKKTDKDYIELATLILPQLNTIEWGGNWKRIQDNPHYQLKAISDNVTVVANLFKEGKPYV